MDRDFAGDGVRSSGMEACMLLNQVELGNHVVVEEQEDFAGGFRRSSIARRGKASVFLLDHSQRPGAVEPANRIGGSVRRAVDHYNDLD
jgi:hypothetical protein